ncbi:MAG: flagellar export chaperone FlgN [Planctomycetota bacterium]
MNQSVVTMLAGELAELIKQLINIQIALRAVVQAKLDAMRRSDTDAMLKAARREGNMAAEVSALDEKRGDIVSRLCAALGMPAVHNERTVPLRALTEVLDPESARPLANLANRLREEMLKLAEANRVVELVSREMLAHFKTLFSAMVQDEDEAPTYSAAGQVGPVVGARVLDAIG